MRKDQLKKFKKLLTAQLNNIVLNERVVREEFSVNSDDRYDELDQATTDSTQSMIMRLGNRNTLLIKKLNEALKRIEDGTYGECDSCGEQIDLRRLESRLMTTLCIACKEDQERKEVLTAAGREHKSLGETFSRRYA